METPNSDGKGWGLGQFETNRISKRQGGSIAVQYSDAGKGATIRMLVPEFRGW